MINKNKWLFVLLFFLPGNPLFAQQDTPFYPPVTIFETTQSLGYKNGVKTVTEYEGGAYGAIKKTVKEFNKKGVLITDESYDKTDDGYHLTARTTYKFQEGRLTEIKEMYEIPGIDESGNIRQYYLTTQAAPYTYDAKGRLKTYTITTKFEDDHLVFHIHYPRENTTQYYYMKSENDSSLVFESRTTGNEDNKTVIDTRYNNGKIEFTKEHYFKNGKEYKRISQSSAGNKTTRYSSEFNRYGDEIEWFESEKQDNDVDFKETHHEYRKYEYDKDGTKLKEFHTNKPGSDILFEETRIEHQNNQKKVTTRQYIFGNNTVSGEIIKIYNNEGELISGTVKQKYTPDDADFAEINTTSYKQEYTFH